VLAEADLSPAAMITAIANALARKPATASFRTNGAGDGAGQIAAWAEALDW
jgi:hypothetical protein